MKKTKLFLIIALVCSVFSISSCTQKGTNGPGILKVEANLKNLPDTVYAILMDSPEIIDTIVAKDGCFNHSFQLDSITALYLVTKNRWNFSVIAMPNESFTLEGDLLTRYDINGSDFYADYHQVDLLMENLKEEDGAEIILEFLRNNPENEANIELITRLAHIDSEKVEEGISLISDKVKNGRMKNFIEQKVADIRKKIEEEKRVAEMQAPGRVAPDFTLNDINGNPLSLSSLKGKYVVLDFWGSWCGWCIKGFPEMINYYQKYAGKFEILGIDCNDSEEKWKASVKEHGLPWLHVYKTNESTVLSDYAIQGFPTKIILDPEGKIVKTIVGETPEFYTLLDELFAEK